MREWITAKRGTLHRMSVVRGHVAPSATWHSRLIWLPRRLWILVDDDEVSLRSSLSAILENVGHRVGEGEDGQVALDLLEWLRVVSSQRHAQAG